MSLRSSNQTCLINSVLEGFLIKLAWNLREACNFIKKEILPQVFSCAFCEISKNTFFTEHLWTTASGVVRVIGFLKKIDNSSSDKFLSPIPVSDWLIFRCGNLIPHYRCANAVWKHHRMFVFLWKYYPGNLAFLILGIPSYLPELSKFAKYLYLETLKFVLVYPNKRNENDKNTKQKATKNT